MSIKARRPGPPGYGFHVVCLEDSPHQAMTEAFSEWPIDPPRHAPKGAIEQALNG